MSREFNYPEGVSKIESQNLPIEALWGVAISMGAVLALSFLSKIFRDRP